MTSRALDTFTQCSSGAPRRLWLMNAEMTPILAIASHVTMNSGQLDLRVREATA